MVWRGERHTFSDIHKLPIFSVVELSGSCANHTDRYLGEREICKEARDLHRNWYVSEDNAFDAALRRTFLY